MSALPHGKVAGLIAVSDGKVYVAERSDNWQWREFVGHRFRGPIIDSGLISDPHSIFMSKADSPADFDYSTGEIASSPDDPQPDHIITKE